MKIITGILSILNILLWLGGIVVGFMSGESLLGIAVIIGFVVFLIAWGISGGVVVSGADYIFQPEWSIFKKKISWANGAGIGIGIIAGFILYSL